MTRVYDKPIKDAEKFSPKIVRPQPEMKDILKYEGLVVKNFPKDLKDEEIVTFVKSVGGEGLQENTEIRLEKNNKNNSATIEPLSAVAVQSMIKLIHFPETKKKFFDVPLYCRAVRAMTPEKPADSTIPTTKEGENTEPIKPNPNLTENAASGGARPKDTIDEIKSTLFANMSGVDSDGSDDDELDPVHLRDEFLKSDEEFVTTKKGKKKRGRKSSNENSDTKQKKKGTKSAKYNN